jgi:hypothetical protein
VVRSYDAALGRADAALVHHADAEEACGALLDIATAA